jgi:hypothetical protein
MIAEGWNGLGLRSGGKATGWGMMRDPMIADHAR